MTRYRLWVPAATLIFVGLLTSGCADEAAIHHGRLAVTTWEMVAQPRDSTAPVRVAGTDSLWSSPGRPGAGGARSSLAGPLTGVGSETEQVRTILLTMASRATLIPEDSVPLASTDQEVSRSWLLDLPVDAGVTIRGRYPMTYHRGESGAWVGQGPVRRDFLWIHRVGGVPDTVRLSIEGTLSDTVGVAREARSLEADGTLSVASQGRVLDLTVRMRGTVTRVPEAEVLRRHEETLERLNEALEGSER